MTDSKRPRSTLGHTIVQRLAVQDVVIQYAACLEEREFDRYRSCFTDDCEFVGFRRESIRGADAWLAFVRKTIQPYSATQHMLGPPRARLEDDRAFLRTDLQAQHFLREPEGRSFTLWGTYRSELAYREDQWRMTRHELIVRATRTSDA